MTQEEFDSLYNRILSALLANSKMATDLRVVESPAGVNLLPGILGGELVALAAQTLKGTDGKNIYLQKTDTAIQWKSGVEGEWVNLILLSDISGSDGRSVVFRDGATGIEWKYDDEPDTAYRLIVSYDELKLTFADLTAEQKQELKPTLADFTAEEISQLQQPATDAAKVVLQEMVQIDEKAKQVIKSAEEAAGKAETAAGNVKDGKTPVLGMVDAQSGDTPSGSFVSDGVDESGNPKYRLNLTLPSGKDGQPVVFEQGITTTLEPTEEARVEVAENGETEQGNPKYTLNFFIPRGQVGKPGEGSGNVSAEGTGLVIGKKYLFVPDSDGSTSGSFVEYIAPEAYDDSSLRTVIANNLAEAKTYTNDQIAGIVQFDIDVVESLPETGVKGTIYLIPKAGSANDVHDEYIWIESTRGYELIGTTSVDLSDYYTRTQSNNTFVKKEAGKRLITDKEAEKLNKINFVPTLDHEPGQNDLTFSDTEGVHTFLIGDQARVMDAEKREYVFWQLYDITSDNKALWKKSGSGGEVILYEELIISLTSNQAQPDANLNGLIVHVLYDDKDNLLEWKGSEMTIQIPADKTYTIVYPNLDGYTVPEEEEFVALPNYTRNVNASYNTTILTINVSSNQTDKNDLSNLDFTLSGSYNKILTYKGQELVVNVPTNREIVITPSQIEGYAIVNPIIKTPIASTESVLFVYNTTIMSIMLTSNQGIDLALNAGTNIAVKCGTINKTLIWRGITLTQKMPTGQAYTITPAELTGYKTPDPKTGTASGTNMSENMEYQTEIVTVTVNTDNGVSTIGQKVTIAGVEYTYNNPISVKIPYGIRYSVFVNSKDGFETPATLEFLANQKSRSVTLTYTEIKRGVYILHMSGELYKQSEWSFTSVDAVGVALLSDNCQFVIDFRDNPNGNNWGNENQVSNILTTSNKSTALTDYKGSENTDQIIAQQGTLAQAANACREVIFKNGRNGYLGSLGEWNEVYNNRTEINACFSLISGRSLQDSEYWSSTQGTSTTAWFLGIRAGTLSPGLKKTLRLARAFASL